MPTYSKHAAILCYMLNLKLHHIKQILVLKILCHQHMHTYKDTLSLPFTVKQKVNLITLLIFDKPIATFSGYLLSGLIEVAYVLVVLASASKFICYLSCFQKLGKHISCLFIITYTAFSLFHLYALRAHF